MSSLRAASAGISTDHYTTLNIPAVDLSECDHADEWISLDAMAAHAESFAGMVVGSEPLRKMVSRITQLAPYKATVLIQGESGTGKELVAEACINSGRCRKGRW